MLNINARKTNGHTSHKSREIEGTQNIIFKLIIYCVQPFLIKNERIFCYNITQIVFRVIIIIGFYDWYS